MGAENKAIGYLELNSQQFTDALATAQKALIAFAAGFSAVKIGEFFKEGTAEAIKFGNEAYFAAQKLNGYDPGKLFIVQKALQAAGLSAEEARGKIESFALSQQPLQNMFKGGSAGFGDALARSAREYGTQAAVLTKSAEEFAFVQTQIGALGTKIQGFFLGLADKIAAPLSALLTQIDKIDLVGMGEKFGKYVVDAINVIRGLVQNKELFSAIGLSLKVGFEVAADFLMQPKLWLGMVKVAIGAFALLGNFLTSVFLGIGNLLVATIEAAFERLREKYGALIAIISPVAGAANYFGAKASTDVSENLRANENSPLIQSQSRGADLINSKSLAVAMSGINDLIKASKGVNLSGADSKELQSIISKAFAVGASQATPDGKKNPVFSETADPFHVIADSLARVGGGGRYVRTGLSIADKAALDSKLFLQQQLTVQKQIEKNTAKSANKNGQPMGGG